jgi:NADH dehydrogenase FAD-containing subunit
MPEFLDVSSASKAQGRKKLLELRQMIVNAGCIVVVGAGALGIQYAGDIKEYFPTKRVVLVHTRDRYLPLYSKKMSRLTVAKLDELGVERIMNDRLVSPLESVVGKHTVLLRSGMEIECDLQLNCTGLQFNTSLIEQLSPDSISCKGTILTTPTLQLASKSCPPSLSRRIFVIGDVADVQLLQSISDTTTSKSPTREVLKNAVSGWFQSEIASRNVMALIADPQAQLTEYEPGPPVIKVTAGLYNYVYQKPIDQPIPKVEPGADEGYVADEDRETDNEAEVGLMETPIDLDAAKMWTLYGASTENLYG